jgi:hypothetical protein
MRVSESLVDFVSTFTLSEHVLILAKLVALTVVPVVLW